jgi:hypothetical protein
MISSNRFGGRGTTAESRVQVGSAAQAESGTILPAKQQPGGSGQGQLFPHHIPDIDVGGALEQGIKVGIIRGLRVRAEDGGIYVDVHLRPDIRQATPTLALHLTMHAAPPQVITIPRSLQLPCDRDGPNQMQLQTFESGIVGPKLPHGPDRASLKVPDVNSQHSRLN